MSRSPRHGFIFEVGSYDDTLKSVNPNRYPVIVTDGLWRKSMSAIRSLGKAGFDVYVMGNTVFTSGFWSRYTRGHIYGPTAAENPQKFGEVLLEYLGHFSQPPILLPMEDPSLLWVSEHRKELEGKALFVLPSEKSIQIAEDKNLTMEHAAALGLPVPQSWRPSSARELYEKLQSFSPDWVIKPCTGSGSNGIIYRSETPPSLEFLEAHWGKYGPLLLQERIPGDGRAVGVSVLMEEGRPSAIFAHERLQQYPVSGGPSTDRQSIHDRELEEYTLRLLKNLEWNGIAMVEWKAGKLMEINPRFWGSLELAIRSGVDFPVLYARRALGGPSALPVVYRDGIRCRWMVPGEVLRYLSTPAAQREGLFKFLGGLPGLSEEWDSRDLAGTLATVICTGALALNPSYWKFLRRG